MIVSHINSGSKITYVITDNKICFDSSLLLDLTKYEKDYSMHLDICLDKNQCLTLGLANRYVAEIDIPPRKYNYPLDENNEPIKSAATFDISRVTLTLWSLED